MNTFYHLPCHRYYNVLLQNYANKIRREIKIVYPGGKYFLKARITRKSNLFSTCISRRVFSFSNFVKTLDTLDQCGNSRVKREAILENYFQSVLLASSNQTEKQDVLKAIVALLVNQIRHPSDPTKKLRYGKANVFVSIAEILKCATSKKASFSSVLTDYSKLDRESVSSIAKRHCGGDVGTVFSYLFQDMNDSDLFEIVNSDLYDRFISDNDHWNLQMDNVANIPTDIPQFNGSILQFYDRLIQIGAVDGRHSDLQRRYLLTRLIIDVVWVRQMDSANARSVTLRAEIVNLLRLLTGQPLKVGVAEKSVIKALSVALIDHSCHGQQLKGDDLKKRKDIAITSVVLAYKACPNIGLFLSMLFKDALDPDENCILQSNTIDSPLEALCRLKPDPEFGQPFESMLAVPANSIEDAFIRAQKYLGRTDKYANAQQLIESEKVDEERASYDHQVFCDHKYDGMRAQLHMQFDANNMQNFEAHLFSRSMDNISTDFHILLAELKKQSVMNPTQACVSTEIPLTKKQRSVILDGEIVLVDRNKNQICSFQDFTRRRKLIHKNAVEKAAQGHSLCIFFSDERNFDDFCRYTS